MPLLTVITIAAAFISIAAISGLIASRLLARTAPELRRLRPQAVPALAGMPSAALPSSRPAKPLRKPKHQSRVERNLAAAGWDDPNALQLYSAAQFTLPILFASVPGLLLDLRTGWILVVLAALIGYLVPDLVLSRRIAQRGKAIQNGLPDALDLLIVCVEAGSSLDQAIDKASAELEIALPPMAHELRTVAMEIRAGKPRLEAFQAFAKRTSLDEVAALVSMLVQSDRFGTSISQGLRAYADTLRTKRRQRAEERAGKVGVKLVFPLILCLLPALYVVCLGPVVVRMIRALS